MFDNHATFSNTCNNLTFSPPPASNMETQRQRERDGATRRQLEAVALMMGIGVPNRSDSGRAGSMWSNRSDMLATTLTQQSET